MQNLSHGIGIETTDSKQVSIVQPFSGNEPEKFSTFITQLTTTLSSKGIPIPITGSPWLEAEEVMFATKDEELTEITDLTPIQASLGYKVGDLALTAGHRKLYRKEVDFNKLKKAHAIALLNQYIVPSSEAYNVINEGFVLGDFERMWNDLHDKYRGARLSVLIVQVERYVDMLTTGSIRLAELIIITTQCKRAFSKILGYFEYLRYYLNLLYLYYIIYYMFHIFNIYICDLYIIYILLILYKDVERANSQAKLIITDRRLF